MKQYPRNLVAALVAGDAPLRNGRVLVRGVTMQEIHGARTGLDLTAATSDPRTVAYHEIVGMADDVPDGFACPDDLALYASAAADAADHTDEECLFWLVHHKHFMAVVNREHAVAAETARDEMQAAIREERRRENLGLPPINAL